MTHLQAVVEMLRMLFTPTKAPMTNPKPMMPETRLAASGPLPFEGIEPFVITSSRKTADGHWIWTRDKLESAVGLAETVQHQMLSGGYRNTTITILDVAAGNLVGTLHCDRKPGWHGPGFVHPDGRGEVMG